MLNEQSCCTNIYMIMMMFKTNLVTYILRKKPEGNLTKVTVLVGSGSVFFFLSFCGSL